MARVGHLNVYIPRSYAGTAQNRKSAFLQVLSVCGNLSMCFLYLIYTAGRRETIASTCSIAACCLIITVSTLSAANLFGILIAFLGRSAIKLLSPVPLISAVRLVRNCHFDNSLC